MGIRHRECKISSHPQNCKLPVTVIGLQVWVGSEHVPLQFGTLPPQGLPTNTKREK